MAQMRAAILNIESSTVTAFLGEKDGQGKLIFKAVATAEHEGFEEGVFIDEQDTKNAITTVVNKIVSQYKIQSFIVGVTGEFLKVNVKSLTEEVPLHKRRLPKDIVDTFDNVTGYTYIYHAPIHLEDTNSKIGQVTSPIRQDVTMYYAKNKFINLVATVLADFKIKNLTFLPTSLAILNYIVPEYLRNSGAILLDVDYLSMTYSVVEGGGIRYQTACSIGGGHLLLDLYTGRTPCAVPFKVAEAMLSKLNLIQPEQEGACIEYIDKNKVYYMPVKQLRDVVMHGLDILCEVIIKCFEVSRNTQSVNYPILLTGCGITDIQGVKEYLSMRLNKNIAILTPTQLHHGKASQSSLVSLLHMGLENMPKMNIFSKFLSNFGGK